MINIHPTRVTDTYNDVLVEYSEQTGVEYHDDYVLLRLSEECAELSKACLKAIRRTNTQTTTVKKHKEEFTISKAELTEEIAHVYIMSLLAMTAYEISEEDVLQEFDKKAVLYGHEAYLRVATDTKGEEK